MNKKSLKPIIVLVIITILVFILRLFINLYTVYIGNNARVITIGSKIIKINNNNKILLRRAKIYKNGNKINGYIKSSKGDMENEYYLVSLNNKKINVNPLIASGSLAKIKVITKTDNTINESAIIELNDQLDLELKKENIVTYKKIILDIDNDGTDEKVIYVSYSINDVSYDKALIIDDSTYELVDYEFSLEDLKEKPQKFYSLVGLIDLNNDNKYEIIVSRIDGNSQPQYYEIYSYNDGKIKEIK